MLLPTDQPCRGCVLNQYINNSLSRALPCRCALVAGSSAPVCLKGNGRAEGGGKRERGRAISIAPEVQCHVCVMLAWVRMRVGPVFSDWNKSRRREGRREGERETHTQTTKMHGVGRHSCGCLPVSSLTGHRSAPCTQLVPLSSEPLPLLLRQCDAFVATAGRR